MIAENAVSLGAEKITVIAGEAPDAIEGMDFDAAFIGGGISTDGVFEAAWGALRAGGRLVANVVTLEGEAQLAGLQGTHGGTLTRLAVSRAEPVGPFRGWRAGMLVTQWVVEKPA